RGSAVAFCPTSNLFVGSGLLPYGETRAAGVTVALGSDVGGGTTFSMLRTLQDAYKVCRITGSALSGGDAFYLATRASAKALRMEGRIGSIEPGCEADMVVLDPKATPLMERRMARSGSLEERLFVLMILGDDRAVS